jgi:hypothetical protein
MTTLPFVLVEPARLENQRDGRRLALEVLRALRDAGERSCSAHPEDGKVRRCGAFLAALYRLATDGTPQAMAGFSMIMSDILGHSLARTDLPELYEDRERRSLIMRWFGPVPRSVETVAVFEQLEPKPKTTAKRKTRSDPRQIDWGALNPGRKMRQAPLPEGRVAPESAEPAKARSPDQDRPK